MSIADLTPAQRLERVHEYHWPDGKPAFAKARYGPIKKFITGRVFRLRDGREEFHAERKPVSRSLPGMGVVRTDTLLYRLPDLLSGIADGRTPWLCEGEKDADSVAATGRVATSSQNGGGNFGAAEAAWLRGARRVIVLMDADLVGVADALQKVKMLRRLDPAPDVVVYSAATGKDVSDHLVADMLLSDLVHVPESYLRETAPRLTPADRARAGYRAVLKAVRA